MQIKAIEEESVILHKRYFSRGNHKNPLIRDFNKYLTNLIHLQFKKYVNIRIYIILFQFDEVYRGKKIKKKYLVFI